MTQVASAPLQAVFPVQTNTRGVTYASLPEAVVSCKATDAGQYTPGSLFGADDPNSATSADSSLDTFRTDSFAGRSGTVQTPCGTLHSGEALQVRHLFCVLCLSLSSSHPSPNELDAAMFTGVIEPERQAGLGQQICFCTPCVTECSDAVGPNAHGRS